MGASGWRSAAGAALMGVVLLAACNGFPETVPIQEAERPPEKYPSYAVEPGPVLSTGQQRWIVLPGAVVNFPASDLQPVAGTQLLALRWDQTPFSALYARAPSGQLHEAAELR